MTTEKLKKKKRKSTDLIMHEQAFKNQSPNPKLNSYEKNDLFLDRMLEVVGKDDID